MREETWKSIEGFPLYEVSDLGRIRSLPRTYDRPNHWDGSSQTVRTGGRVLRGWVKSVRGRPVCVMVALRRDGKTYEERVHRLVLGAFVGPPGPGEEGCHNDGDPLNNAAENLRWDTHSANLSDMTEHGTRAAPPVFRGEAHHNTTLTAEQVRAIRATPLVRGAKARMAREYGVSAQTIHRILEGRVWTHVR